ncbi:hypothetical protein N0V83_008296 [Neocucurbitaria cava]|uniref:Uncharacterized protein n=1 Tax=Neocucurbitaria cava TaxID=798079 RepID=A0A9W9CJE9_9PLEO|nr:hypothetical protein N0V83_008296 [Neocucurbitaria cava]
MCATAPASGPITSRPPTNYTWTPISTGPYTVLPGNTTWFSGNVYVSLNRINGQCDWSGTPVEVGSTHNGQVLTMAPSELFSQRAFLTNIGDRSSMVDFEPYAYSFNFDDLVSPYPWSAWDGAFDCVKTKCSTISGSYNPWIAVPEAIRRLDPKWATCDLALYGLYDPPIALSTVGNMFATTTKPPQSGPQPTPGQAPPQSQVEPTNTPPKPGASLPPWQSDPATILPPVVGPPADPGPSPQPGNSLTPQDPNPQNPSPGNPNSQNPDPQIPNPQNPQAPNPQNPNDPSDPSRPGSPGSNAPRPVLTPAPLFPQPTTIGTIGSTPIIVNPSNPTQVSVGTTLLTPGAPGITVGAGTSISMRDPSHIIISAPGAPAPSTINVPQPIGGKGGAPTPTAGVVITMPDGSRVTATAVIGEGHAGSQAATSIVVSGTMLSEGGPPITLANGVVLSEAPSGTGVVVINPASGVTSTIAFSSMPGIYNPLSTTPAAPSAVITVGGHTYTAITRSGSVVIPELGITLMDGGPAVTLDGTTVSDAGQGTGVVVGTSTAGFVTPTGGGGGHHGGGEEEGAAPTGAGVRMLGSQWWMVHWWFGLGFLGSVVVVVVLM